MVISEYTTNKTMVLCEYTLTIKLCLYVNIYEGCFPKRIAIYFNNSDVTQS